MGSLFSCKVTICDGVSNVLCPLNNSISCNGNVRANGTATIRQTEVSNTAPNDSREEMERIPDKVVVT
jgi:hypothetical protein